ncbi:Rhomboid family protein [Emticicia oligotrophica DSM 17448]|uniref:Rhomboid family protein n=1 Tax=Emticicia oligotrophica (strain DSM 17448 / CIP 109782 / MTCC 6937 / GPTSA100-15) TaxID=929562 RepID=A0ABM5N235_EMTOG|nr:MULTISPECIES: rhomboid family intramembrane serine protease [Emticicia]AFK03457.1 Rhomboid family protein [Emticicia oligotrophica DSM 17448]
MYQVTPIVRNLLIINIVVYVIQHILRIDLAGIFGYHNFSLYEMGLFNPVQIFTYMFLHGGTGHIFSNMFGLYMFGPMLEHFLGSKRFLTLYLVSGIGACVLHGVVNLYEISQLPIDSPEYTMMMSIPMVGASGAIFGMLGAFARLFPNTEMIIFPLPIPIKAKYLVSLYALFEIFSGIYSIMPGVAHFAHIGGLIFGILLINYWNKKKDRFY